MITEGEKSELILRILDVTRKDEDVYVILDAAVRAEVISQTTALSLGDTCGVDYNSYFDLS